MLRRATGLAGDLGRTLAAVERLAADPLTLSTLRRLLATVESAKPTLEEIAPLQTVCNYIGLWTRNVVSTISEGDASGNWFRTLVVGQPAEVLASAEPAPDLHVNPYPNYGQNGECEAGNEPFAPGRAIGNVEGDQGLTEPTSPPADAQEAAAR